MNLKNAGIKAVALAMGVGLMAVPAYAVEKPFPTSAVASSQWITPFWVDVNEVIADISSSGKTLYPEVYIKAKSTSAKITGTLYLEKYSSGKWKKVTSWSISGTGSLLQSESYSGSSGTSYRTRVEAEVGGESVDSTSVTCKL